MSVVTALARGWRLECKPGEPPAKQELGRDVVNGDVHVPLLVSLSLRVLEGDSAPTVSP
jgi:hypothetical protein